MLQLLRALRGRYRIALTTLLLVVAGTVAISLLLPKTYSATASVVLNYKGTDSLTGHSLPPVLQSAYMATQIDIIKSKGVAGMVVDALGLTQRPEIRSEFVDATSGRGDIRDWTAERLLTKLRVTPSRESSVIGVKYSSRDPEEAARITNEFVNQYRLATVRLKTEPLQGASEYLGEQVKSLREKLEASHSRLSRYQQEKGIVTTEAGNDMELTNLNDLAAQLVTVQGQLTDMLARQKQAQGRGAATAPDIVSDPVVQNLKSALAQAEARLARAKAQLQSEHPRYQDAQAEVDQLRASLRASIRTSSRSIDTAVRALQQREAVLQEAVNAQKARLLELNRARDEMSVLQREAENAQQAYDASLKRLTQINLEGNANQSDVSLLQAALVPAKPTSPNLRLNLAMAIFLGTLLGIGVALLAELFDRRVRSAKDLVDIIGAPVLGTFEKPARLSQRLPVAAGHPPLLSNS